MKYTVICVASESFSVGEPWSYRDEEGLPLLMQSVSEPYVTPYVQHVEAENMQEAEFAASSELSSCRSSLVFVAVFEGHLVNLKQ